ncbi:MAG: fused MFS/spermidine synthase [Sphingomonadaceae bacterium]|nr:fused MFS/spermidine synthase [Sphingomonadaceae bacterium]
MNARLLRLRYTLTICAGSFLLFLVQPMIARMALPRLGGAPAVWNSAMLVYQALLLGGYAYAHSLGRLRPKQQAGVHIALFLVAALMLPIGLIASMPSATANPFVWVPWLLVASIGPLFFVVAAQAPLMQRWFAVSGGGDPYPLYAASNLGSFAGLIAYPLIVEPLLPLAGQSLLWSAGFGVLLVLVASCALSLPKTTEAPERIVASRTPGRTIAIWIVLAAVPSGLMLSTTTHLTTDVIAMPLLWAIPLGLYLLSFSVAFATDRRIAQGFTTATPLLLLIGGGAAFANSAKYPLLFAPIGLLLLFAVAVSLHSALYDRRPAPERLTEFYLAMSAGGALGGLFCALIAPLVFDWAYEHPLLILAAAALVAQRPVFAFGERLGRRGGWVFAVAALAASAIGGLAPSLPQPAAMLVAAFVVIFIAILAIGRRRAFVACLAALMLTLGGWGTLNDSWGGKARVRSYFGIYTVGTNPGPTRFLVHGTTVHGLQSLRPGHERDPLSYYAPKSGVGYAMRDTPALFGPRARIGVVGLGAGTLACYAEPGQDWRFYEIDPAIAAIARDPARFTFLSRCLPGVPVEIGDARIVLAGEPPSGLDLLVVDAFSSDAVPMHLLTREAFAVYARRLAPNGLLMVHISNRFLKLEPVVAAAQANGWHAMVREYHINAAEARRSYSTSMWVALSRDPATVARLARDSGAGEWRPARMRLGFAGWTDDHASIMPLLIFRQGD